MSGADRRVRVAFDRLAERRERTTDVAAAFEEVRDRCPWWERRRPK